jgi:8-amino-7-oxononanoate synthase
MPTPNQPREQVWADHLERLKETHAYRLLATDGWRVPHSFSSNDYLGLSQHPAMMETVCEAVRKHGTGGVASRLVSGHTEAYQALESELAAWKGTEAALVFPTGYQANIALLQALIPRNAYVFADKLNHASLVDGLRLSGATVVRYRHGDYDDLETRLKRARLQAPMAPFWLVSDSLFSMDGDLLHILRWCELAETYGASTFLDEAHACGVFGTHGRGWADACGVSHRITVQMGTFSKALGSLGAYVAGSLTLKEYLCNTARGFIYTTALPPGVVAANLCAIRLLQDAPGIRASLWDNIHYFRACLVQNFPALQALQWPASESQIFSFLLQENERALHLANALFNAGFEVKAIRPPTVPPGQSRLRVCVTAAHTPEVLWQFCEAFQAVLASG